MNESFTIAEALRNYGYILYLMERAVTRNGGTKGSNPLPSVTLLTAKGRISETEKALTIKVIEESYNFTKNKAPKSLDQYNSNFREVIDILIKSGKK